MSPFYANYGFHPRFLSEFTPTEVPAADEFASLLREVHDCLVENVKRTQDFQARHYDRKYKPTEFQLGDLVWLNATNITTTRPSKKLDWKRLGPFKIVKRIDLQAYQLELPITMRYIHNVCHVSLLKLYKSTPMLPHGFPPPLPPLYTKDSHDYFEIEAILDSKADRRTTKYLIKWKGYPNSDNSWEPLSNIPTRALVKEYHHRNHGKPGAPRTRKHVAVVNLLNHPLYEFAFLTLSISFLLSSLFSFLYSFLYFIFYLCVFCIWIVVSGKSTRRLRDFIYWLRGLCILMGGYCYDLDYILRSLFIYLHTHFFF
jgi:hypothetical protein